MSSSNSHGLSASYTSIAFTVLAAICVVTRLIARVQILKIAGGDEVAITIALLCSIAFTVFINLQVNHGLGKHIETLSAGSIEKVLKYLWASILPYNGSLTLTKIAIVLQYLRVFVGRRTRIACRSMICLITVYGVWTIISAIFSCVPIALFWDSSLTGGCIPKKFLWFFNASVNIVTDITILILPMPVISTLKLPVKQKIGLIGIFALGGFVCIVSIIRLRSLYILSTSTDPTWDNTDAAIWSSIEINIGITCASLPTIKPVISWFFPRLLSTNHSTGYTHQSQNNQSTHHSRVQFRNAHIPLFDIGTAPKTVIKAESSEENNGTGDEKDSKGHRGSKSNNSTEILVTSTMTQDVERRSDTGSEKDLIFQKQTG